MGAKQRNILPADVVDDLVLIQYSRMAALPGWLLLDVPGCSWLLLAAPGCSSLLLAAPGCCWLLCAPLVLAQVENDDFQKK